MKDHDRFELVFFACLFVFLLAIAIAIVLSAISGVCA